MKQYSVYYQTPICQGNVIVDAEDIDEAIFEALFSVCKLSGWSTYQTLLFGICNYPETKIIWSNPHVRKDR